MLEVWLKYLESYRFACVCVHKYIHFYLSSCQTSFTDNVVTLSNLPLCLLSYRVNHQPRPVQYREIEGVIEALTRKFSELSLPSRSGRRSSVSQRHFLSYPRVQNQWWRWNPVLCGGSWALGECLIGLSSRTVRASRHLTTCPTQRLCLTRSPRRELVLIRKKHKRRKVPLALCLFSHPSLIADVCFQTWMLIPVWNLERRDWLTASVAGNEMRLDEINVEAEAQNRLKFGNNLFS